MATLTSWKSGVSPRQMREIDRAAEKDYGISPHLLMEVAGLATARVARSLIGSPLTGRRVCILAGPGNNGGDGLVAARRLAGWDATLTVITSYAGDAARGLSQSQLELARRAGAEIGEWRGEIPRDELIIDALLGFGATGAPRGAIQEMIVAVNQANVPVLALDVPSGIDAASGAAAGDCIIAGATVTLALVKTGLLAPTARSFVGNLFLADIGIPPALLREVGVDARGLFASNDILELDPATGDIRRG
ncbi:MAG TPA: NAD(P)H-hydrate epimerase [Candidatus Dormibacteraeota bacterium]|nr:NAD(P)H-hydrate epimerase [Candidatus Dormibacteraeota bacterium]